MRVSTTDAVTCAAAAGVLALNPAIFVFYGVLALTGVAVIGTSAVAVSVTQAVNDALRDEPDDPPAG